MNTILIADIPSSLRDLLPSVQQDPIVIDKDGQPIAVIISYEEYQYLEELRMERLRKDIQAGIDDINNGRVTDCEEVFQEIRDRLTDK